MGTARKTDPATSHETRVSNTALIRQAIVDILRTAPLSDREITRQYEATRRVMGYPALREGEGDVRKRRAELVKIGAIKYAGIDSYQQDTKSYQRVWMVNR